ncbi:hypothetical protein, partial [Pseudomonas viridiflava]
LMQQLDNTVKQTTEQLEGQNISDGEQYCKLSVVVSQSAYVAAYDADGDRICQTKASSRPDVREATLVEASQANQRISLYDSQHNHEWRAQII